MKYKNILSILVVSIVVLSLTAALVGIFSNQGQGQYEFKSINGTIVKIQGKGLYKNDSVAVAAQGKAQDIVTVIIGIPLLIASLFLTRKDLLKGKVLLAGTLGYFLYTYISYTFLCMFNSLFNLRHPYVYKFLCLHINYDVL